MTSKQRRCTKCGETKPIIEFPRHGRYKSGEIKYDSWCRTCRLAQQKERYDRKKKDKAPINDTRLHRKGYPGSCDVCKFLEPCRVLVTGKLTRDIVVDGASARIYLQPYCFVDSTLHKAFLKVYEDIRI